MKRFVLRILDAQPGEGGRVAMLLVMSFFMGVFLATISVASQSLFLQHFKDELALPKALLYSGVFGVMATALYNFLQNRIPFPVLAVTSLTTITCLTAFIEFGGGFFSDPQTIFFLGFTLIIPFTFITYLVFWGAFGRLFNLKQSKRLVGAVDQGAMIASFIAFFSIPAFLALKGVDTERLYTISLVSISIFTLLFVILSFSFLAKARTFAQEKLQYKKLTVKEFFQGRYILFMSLFVIFSTIAVSFVNYSFLKVAPLVYTDPEALTKFISYFELTIVVFGFLFDVFATDRVLEAYGMRVALLVSPVLLGFFTITALILGSIFGYTPEGNSLFIFFFIIIAVTRLFASSLKDALDNPTFKFYLLPIEGSIRIDVQTKIEGLITAFASVVAGGLIILIMNVDFFSLIYITLFTVPLIIMWLMVVNRMHGSYKKTLEETLALNKTKMSRKAEKEYTIKTVLEKEVNSSAEEKAIYGLKLMEKLEPALFENSVIRLADSNSPGIRAFAEEKIKTLELQGDGKKSDIRSLAEKASSESEDSDLLSISPEKLMKLSKSVKQADRILAAKLLRKLISTRTIFILLELLRDVDPKVRFEALFTARKVKRQETWPVLIELLNSPSYSHQAASALKEAGEAVLATLESAFHKSGQSDMVMLRIVQIMGRIGGRYALQLLWKKADFPDKRIVKQILYSLRYIHYRAEGREARHVIDLLESEMSKTIWNLAALDELPETNEFVHLRDALKEEVTENYDQITLLLSILYDPESIQLVRENIETGDPDNIAFAMELMDLFIDPELKPMLVPLLDDMPIPEKLKHLQVYFPRENYNPIQVINYILNRDFNQNNRWTKACAVHASAFIPDFRISRGLVAQVFNTDRVLQETAAWVIYNKDQKAYETIGERIPQRDKKFMDSSIEKNQLLDGLDDGFFLGIEMVMFIKQSPIFKNIHGSLLSDLADKITPLDLDPGESTRFNPDDHNTPIFIIAHGEVALKNDQTVLSTLKAGDVFGDLFQNGPIARANALEAIERSVIFKINLMDFYFVMANHHELVQGLIKNITEENKHYS
ncbi:MAG: hypothetical protein ABI663_19960 [Chryseolinea sp.]